MSSEQHDAIMRIDETLDLILRYGGIDGEHHKQWLIDQIVRKLTGNDSEYADWLIEFRKGDDGPHTYQWDEGIAP